MVYIIIEMQTNNGQTAIVPPVSYSDRNQAESNFHLILGAAAISQVQEHTAVMLTEDGRLIRTECYKHSPEPEPEDEEPGMWPEVET